MSCAKLLTGKRTMCTLSKAQHLAAWAVGGSLSVHTTHPWTKQRTVILLLEAHNFCVHLLLDTLERNFDSFGRRVTRSYYTETNTTGRSILHDFWLYSEGFDRPQLNW